MRTRILWLLLGLLLVGVLALGSLGVVLTQVHTSQASGGMMNGKRGKRSSEERNLHIGLTNPMCKFLRCLFSDLL